MGEERPTDDRAPADVQLRDDLDPDAVVELLNGTPGVTERIAQAREEIKRGEGIPLSDL